MPDAGFDVIIVGAGCGGICASIQAARQGARVLLVEREKEIGGTGIHSPVALICKFQRRDTYEPVNLGLHRELFPHAYLWSGEFGDDDMLPTYDHRELYQRYINLLSPTDRITVLTGRDVVKVETILKNGFRHITSIYLSDGISVTAKVFVDGTADGNLSAMAGAEYQLGSPCDGKLMPATLTFIVKGFDVSKLRNPAINTWGGYRSLNRELSELLDSARKKGLLPDGHYGTHCFAYPNGQELLFNANHIFDVNPLYPESVILGYERGKELVALSIKAIRLHPAFKDIEVTISPRLGVREGRRIIGDYILTGEDCLKEARFSDVVAAGAYDIDIHSPYDGSSRLQRIPNTQYYHIPYRCLCAKGISNLLLGSRCISGDFIAHSSYRVMSTVTAIGQAAGCAAALAVSEDGNIRNVSAESIRYELARYGQWVEKC